MNEEYNLNRIAHRVLDGAINPRELKEEELNAIIEMYELWMDHYTYDQPINDWDYEPPGLSDKLKELKKIKVKCRGTMWKL